MLTFARFPPPSFRHHSQGQDHGAQEGKEELATQHQVRTLDQMSSDASTQKEGGRAQRCRRRRRRGSGPPGRPKRRENSLACILSRRANLLDQVAEVWEA